MDLDTLRASLDDAEPPAQLSSELLVLWHERAGNWDRAHDIVNDLPDPDGAWLHAYLHRREGDLSNADYWYRRAGKKRPSFDMDEEWATLCEHFSRSRKA